jgi:uncharacterized membrane protein YdbT with pleckstrin-like domain
MAWPEDTLTADESVVTKFRPHWKLLFVPIGFFLLGLIALFIIFQWIPGSTTVDLVLTGLVIVALLILVVKPLIDWYYTWYVLTTERLITRSGVIARRGIEIPLENINNVNFSQGVFERLLGAGDLLIESAGETGQSEFRDIPRPDEFQALLYRTREARTLSLAEGTSPSPARPSDATERLQRLAALHRDGVLSDEEYEEKRRKLLDEI